MTEGGKAGPRPGLEKLRAYIGGKDSLPDGRKAIKLSSNESALGTSPEALLAIKSALVHRYPDSSCQALRQALAKHHRLDADNIVCGNGSDDLIRAVVEALTKPGDQIVMSRHGFVYYAIVAAIAGVEAIQVPEVDCVTDINALAQACTPATRILFLANPNNPTGSWLPLSQILALRQIMPTQVILVLDGAYAEYMVDDDYSPGYDLVKRHDNIFTLATFSKIYGLSGLRIGWGYGPSWLVQALHKIRAPFNVNTAAQAAAIAALADHDFTQKVRDHTITWRQWLAEHLQDLGLKVYPSVANFLLVRFASTTQARQANSNLRTAGILVRQIDEYGLDDCLRISIGRADENRLVLKILRLFIQSSH